MTTSLNAVIASNQKFKPSDISGLVLWLDASDVSNTGTQPTNGQLNTWVDKSTAGNNGYSVGTTLLQSAPYRVTFNGLSYYNTNLSASSTSETTCSRVKIPVGGSSTQTYLAPSNTPGRVIATNSGPTLAVGCAGVGNYASGTLPSGGSNATFSTKLNGDVSNIYINGTAYTGSWTNGGTNLTGIGGSAIYGGLGWGWASSVYEVCVYNRPLTDTERGRVETYLNAKWT